MISFDEGTPRSIKIKDTFDNLPYSIIFVTFSGLIKYINEKAERLFNIELEEIINKNLFLDSPLSKELLIVLEKKFDDVISGDIFGKKAFCIRLNEKPHLLNLYMSQIKLFKESYIQIIIDELKVQQSITFQSEKKFKDIIENSKEGYFELDLEGKFTFVNQALCNSLGYTSEELLGMSYKNLMDEQTIKKAVKAFNGVYRKNQEKKHFQYEIITKSGEILYGETNINLVYNSEGEIIGFRGFMRDITEQKRSEIKLKESEKRFRTLYENIPCGTVIIDENYRIKGVNQRTCEITGFSDEELCGKLCDIICPKGSLSKRCPIWEGNMASFKDMDTFIKCQDGSETPILKNAKRIQIDGKVHILENIYDNSHQKEVETLIKKENKKLKELEKMRKKFLDVAAHELKTPLTSLYGASQLLTELYHGQKFSNNSEFEELLTMINNSSERLVNLVSNLLDISRIETNNFKLEKKPKDLTYLLSKCLRDIKYLIKARNLTITENLPEELIIKIDAQKIERVIINLISNAIKYTPSGGSIRIDLLKKDHSALLSITDSGIGLTKDQIKKVFNKFADINKPTDEYNIKMDGSGLGLHISKEIVKLHNGEITAESEGLNRGSTFTIKLPL
jgi:PAS domain S-box-containing protein